MRQFEKSNLSDFHLLAVEKFSANAGYDYANKPKINENYGGFGNYFLLQ